jgi:hypothetical protein
MVQFGALLSSAGRRLDRLLLLAVVPLVAGIASPGNFSRIAADTSTMRFGVSFGFPSAVATGWDFVSLPNPEPGLNVYPAGLGTVQGVGLILGSAALTGVLAAAYLGALRRDLLDEGAGASDGLRRLPALVAFELLVALFALGLAGVATVSLALVLVGLALSLYLAYRLYPTPYLVIMEDRSLADALHRSVVLSSRGGPYTNYFVKYLLAVAAVSLVATPLFTTTVFVAVLGIVVLAPVCVHFNAATMLFLDDLTDPAGPTTETPRHWDPDARAVQTSSASSASSNSPVDM